MMWRRMTVDWQTKKLWENERSVRQYTDRIAQCCYAVAMDGRGGLTTLEDAWRAALADYVREVKKTLELLTTPGLPDAGRLEVLEQQRMAEQEAFEKFRRARRAFMGSFLGAVAGVAVVALNALEFMGGI